MHIDGVFIHLFEMFFVIRRMKNVDVDEANGKSWVRISPKVCLLNTLENGWVLDWKTMRLWLVTPKLWGKHPKWYMHWVIRLTQPKSKTLWPSHIRIASNGSDVLGITPTNLNLKGGGLVSCQIIWNIEGTWWAFKPQHQGRLSGNEPPFQAIWPIFLADQ